MKVEMPEYFQELMGDYTPPCVSLYMPTLRAKPPAAENPRRLSNLVGRAEEEIDRHYPHQDMKAVRQRLQDLLRTNEDLWRHPTDGLAVFASPDYFRMLKLQRPVRERIEIAESFHIKPLMRAHQFTGRYQVLCLSQGKVSIYQGNQDLLEEVPLKNVPRSIDEALGRFPPGVPDETQIGRISGAMDSERFLRVIDQAVWENHSRASGLPLMLCAIDRYHGEFRRISHNPYLMTEGVKLDPEAITVERLREEAWHVMEPEYRRQIEKVLDAYARARAHQQGSEDIAQVAEAATFSRVGMLLVDADKQIGGRIDPQSGRIEFGDLSSPDYDDLLDEIAEKVIKTGGQVLIMPAQQMPAPTGLAAIYRF